MFLVAVAESVVTWKVLLQKTNPQTGHKPKLPVSQPLEDFSSSPLRIYQDPKGQYIVFQPSLGRGFKYFLCSLLLGEIIQFDSLTNIFRMGWNHQLVIFRGRAVKLREVFFRAAKWICLLQINIWSALPATKSLQSMVVGFSATPKDMGAHQDPYYSHTTLMFESLKIWE